MKQEKEILNSSEAAAREYVETGKEETEEGASKKAREEDALKLEIEEEIETFSKITQTLRELIIFIKQPTEKSKTDESRAAAEIKQKIYGIIEEVPQLLETQKIYTKEVHEVLQDIEKEIERGGNAKIIEERIAQAVSFIKEIDKSAKEIIQLEKNFKNLHNQYITAALNESGFKNENEFFAEHLSISIKDLKIISDINSNRRLRYGFGLFRKKEIAELKIQLSALEKKIKIVRRA